MTQFEKQIIRETVKQFKDAIKLLENMNAPPGLLDPYRLALTKADGCAALQIPPHSRPYGQPAPTDVRQRVSSEQGAPSITKHAVYAPEPP